MFLSSIILIMIKVNGLAIDQCVASLISQRIPYKWTIDVPEEVETLDLGGEIVIVQAL